MTTAAVDMMNLPLTALSAREVPLVPQSFDAATGRFSYVLATENPIVSSRTINGKEVQVEEVLLMSGLRNLDRIAETKILDCHRRSSWKDVLGRQISGKIEGNSIVCVGELSSRVDVKPLHEEIQLGNLSKMSAGYSIRGQRLKPPAKEGGLPLVEVFDWEIDEASVVPVPADIAANIRAQNAPNGAPPMSTESALEKALADAATSFTASVLNAVRAAAKPPAPAPDPAAAAATAEAKRMADEKAKREKDEKDAMERAAAAGGKREDGADDGGGDDMDGDGRKKRSAQDLKDIAELRLITGANPVFDAMVNQGAPMVSLRAQAFAKPALKTATIAVPAELATQPQQRAKGFVAFSEFETGKPKA